MNAPDAPSAAHGGARDGRPKPRVAIVGGGMAGLSTAYALLEADRREATGLQVRLYEASERLGGVVRTERRGEWVLDLGPDSMFNEKRAGLELALELGLGEELISAHSERPVMIWWEGRLHPLPIGLALIAPLQMRPFFSSSLFTFGGKVRAALEPLVPARRSRRDESIASFVRRRFGRQVLDRVGDPLLSGIHAGDPELLSIEHTFPRFPALERRHGSVVRGMRKLAKRRKERSDAAAPSPGAVPGDPTGVGREILDARFVSLKGGMEVLIDAVTGQIRRLDPETLRCGAPVDALEALPDGNGYRLGLADGSESVVDACVLAVPARAAADLVGALDGALARELRTIPYVSTLAAYLAYPPGSVTDGPRSTGCLVPHSQGQPVFACSLVDQKFDHRVPAGGKLIRAFMGGMRKPDLVRADDSVVAKVARDAVATILGIEAEPEFIRIERWPRANPQYVVGHGDVVATIDARLSDLPGLWIIGSSCRGVGVPDTVQSGRECAAEIRSYLAGSSPRR